MLYLSLSDFSPPSFYFHLLVSYLTVSLISRLFINFYLLFYAILSYPTFLPLSIFLTCLFSNRLSHLSFIIFYLLFYVALTSLPLSSLPVCLFFNLSSIHSLFYTALTSPTTLPFFHFPSRLFSNRLSHLQFITYYPPISR